MSKHSQHAGNLSLSYIYSKAKNPQVFFSIYGKMYDIPTLWLTPSTTQVSGILISDDRKDDSEQQKAKLRYAKVQILPSIIQDTTPNTLRDFLINLFVTRGDMKEVEAKRYLDDMGIKKFMNSITHSSVYPNNPSMNYEMMEHFGDANVNKSATWFLKSAFPEVVAKGNLGLQIFNRQKALIVSKTYLARYCERINLDKLIRYRPLPYYYLDPKQPVPPIQDMNTVTLNYSMKEDGLEAIMGCIEDVIDSKEGFVGIGYATVFKIMSSIYSEEKIPTTKGELVDYKTQLKEVFDRFKTFENYNFAIIYDKDQQSMSLIIYFKETEHHDGNKQNIITGPPNLPINEQGYEFAIGIGPFPLKGTSGELEVYKNMVERQLAKEALMVFHKYYPSDQRFVRFKFGE